MSERGRPVPSHGSGGGEVRRATDPDETRGRAHYRAMAEAEARASLVPDRKARLLASGSGAKP
jgi:hypothetical protein